jgi:hypothetical protein
VTDATDPSSPSATAPRRSTSKKATLQRQLARLLADSPTSARWTPEGFRPDLRLLGAVLARTDPSDVRSGSVATGLDLWAAATLRRAGLQGIRPYAAEPFFVGSLAARSQPTFDLIDQAIRELQELTVRLTSGSVPRALRTLAGQLKRLRAEVERSTTSVLGESRKKQVDVFMAEWDRGLELLISTKTFALAVDPGDLVKNLPNRWEEFDGDLKNLRGRFPLAVIGALTILPAMALQGTLPAFVDMMMKLTAPGRPWVNAYDRATIIVADWDQATKEFVPILNDDLDEGQLPAVLQPATFFDELLRRLFERAPVQEHQAARMAAAEAKGEDTTAIAAAAAAVEESALENEADKA